MSRYLFVVPPLAGHINPTVAVGRELERRGHTVAWVGHPEAVAALLPDGCQLLAAGGDMTATDLEVMHDRWLGLRGFAALRSLWDDVLLPIARAMRDGVEAAVEAFGPNAVVADQQAITGAAVAWRRRLPWATSATTFSELGRPYAAMPAVEAWIADELRQFALCSGVDPAEAHRGNLRFSDQLVLVFTSPELAGSVEVACSPVFVGPAIAERPSEAAFAWDWLDPVDPVDPADPADASDTGRPTLGRRQRVLVSLGTHNGGAGDRFYRVLLEAVAKQRASLQLILVAPSASHTALGEVADHVLVVDRVPQLALLDQVDAVVTHGGLGTVSEALLAGKPMVVAPIRDDQPLIAERVEALGAGVRVSFGRARAGELAAAIESVLREPTFAAAAHRAGDGLRAAGGAPAAADQLEKLV
ncbi:MAG: glycosyltransferase [Acidimicrobiales bacterium]